MVASKKSRKRQQLN